jgi:hypothetical protein
VLTRPAIALAMAGLMAAALVSLTSEEALAGDGLRQVTCQQGSAPGCTATAGSMNASTGTASTGGAAGCQDAAGNPAPCMDPNLGWMGSDGCYYKETTGNSQALLATFGPTKPGPGGWYLQTCLGSTNGTQRWQLVWVPGAAPVPPVVVARQAASQLRLDSPRIGSSPSPGTAQLVSLPTWLWIDRAGWGDRSATAAVPGVSVTATATATSVTFSMGDGSTVVCHGPGTVFPAGGDPKAASPDCGHTYTRSSAGQPGGAFAVTATVTWAITWAGGGQAGTLPAMTTQATAAFTVAESQALVTAGSSS